MSGSTPQYRRPLAIAPPLSYAVPTALPQTPNLQEREGQTHTHTHTIIVEPYHLGVKKLSTAQKESKTDLAAKNGNQDPQQEVQTGWHQQEGGDKRPDD